MPAIHAGIRGRPVGYVRPGDRGITFPPFGPEHLPNSLRHLAELAAGAP